MCPKSLDPRKVVNMRSFTEAQVSAKRPKVTIKGSEVTITNLAIPHGYVDYVLHMREEGVVMPDEMRAEEVAESLSNFWEALAKLQLKQQEETETWRRMLSRTLKNVTKFEDGLWIQRQMNAKYKEPRCVLCREERTSDAPEHWLFECHFTARLWRDVQMRPSEGYRNWREMYADFEKKSENDERVEWHQALASFVHSMWRIRIHYRWHRAKEPAADYRYLVDFIRAWLVDKGSRYPDFT